MTDEKTILVRTREIEAEAQELVGVLPGLVITTPEQYEVAAGLVKDIAHKIKVADQERTISVKPLNDEVKRINDWFRPGLTKLKQVEEGLRKLMGDYVLRQRAEAARLAAEAAAAAQRALATSAEPASEATALLKQAAAAEPPKVAGVSDKVRWTWRITDATKLPRAFQKLVPDETALDAWVAAHGDKDVPAGVEVVPDVRFTVRGR